MESGVRAITVTYDEKRFRFNTGCIETLETDGERKIKLKELFDVFSKNRTYIRLHDASNSKCAIILIILSLIFSVVFLALAVSDQNKKSNDDVQSEVAGASTLLGITDNSWQNNKNAAYWIIFALSLMMLLFTTLLLISHQVRQRRLYHSLEKYELDTIGEYMPFFKDAFMIKRIHRKKKIFKFFNCLFSFRFGYEVRVLDESHADAVISMRRRNNDYHVGTGTDTDLNITGDLDNRQHRSQVYTYRDTEAYHINNKEI